MAGDFDIEQFSHREVDRFSIILDIWNCEAVYQECKKNLIDCYMEAYFNNFDRDERRRIAQVITNLMHRRPRFDFEEPYFVTSYRLECAALRLELQLVKKLIDKQIESQREYVQKVCRDGDSEFGLPLKIVPKNPIASHSDR